jgi:hypothetical protein
MANFAKMNDNIVEQVIVVSNADLDGFVFPESEPVGQAFIASLGLEGEWLQTSYTGAYRGLYAGMGFTFDASLGEYGEFVAPQSPPVEPPVSKTITK